MSVQTLSSRPVCGGRVSSRRVFRLGLAALLFLVLPVAADAYTLVLRSGRHVTVPDDFRVTAGAVTYEAAPGFRVTVWLLNIDFAATERANGGPAGSFAERVRRELEGRGASGPAPETPRAGRRAGPRVVTNKELEPSRLRREAQEEEYERTRRERGMPSKQELQERVEEQDRRLREMARRMEEARKEAELESLRSELVEVRRHLNGLSLHLSRQAAASGPAYPAPDYYPYFYAPPAQFVTVLPFGHRGRFGRGHSGPRPHGFLRPHHPRAGRHSPPIYVSPSRGAAVLPRTPPPTMRAPRRER